MALSDRERLSDAAEKLYQQFTEALNNAGVDWADGEAVLDEAFDIIDGLLELL